MPSEFVFGLDLGQSQDYSALAIAECCWQPKSVEVDRQDRRYAVRHLQRWPLGTDYPTVVAELVNLVRTPPLTWPVLVVDQTGVGQAVADFLSKAPLAARLERVSITAGKQTTHSANGVWRVPKKEMVRCLQAVLVSRRLQVAAVPQRAALMNELLAFRVKITSASQEAFAAGREKDHDDLVLAVALATWWGEHRAGRPAAQVQRGGD
jgi:hypothetical protein